MKNNPVLRKKIGNDQDLIVSDPISRPQKEKKDAHSIDKRKRKTRREKECYAVDHIARDHIHTEKTTRNFEEQQQWLVGWLVVLGLTAL